MPKCHRAKAPSPWPSGALPSGIRPTPTQYQGLPALPSLLNENLLHYQPLATSRWCRRTSSSWPSAAFPCGPQRRPTTTANAARALAASPTPAWTGESVRPSWVAPVRQVSSAKQASRACRPDAAAGCPWGTGTATVAWKARPGMPGKATTSRPPWPPGQCIKPAGGRSCPRWAADCPRSQAGGPPGPRPGDALGGD